MKRTGKKTALTAAVCVLYVLLIAAGEDVYSLENRLEWNGVLRQTYELIKEQN